MNKYAKKFILIVFSVTVAISIVACGAKVAAVPDVPQNLPTETELPLAREMREKAEKTAAEEPEWPEILEENLQEVIEVLVEITPAPTPTPTVTYTPAVSQKALGNIYQITFSQSFLNGNSISAQWWAENLAVAGEGSGYMLKIPDSRLVYLGSDGDLYYCVYVSGGSVVLEYPAWTNYFWQNLLDAYL